MQTACFWKSMDMHVLCVYTNGKAEKGLFAGQNRWYMGWGRGNLPFPA